MSREISITPPKAFTERVVSPLLESIPSTFTAQARDIVAAHRPSTPEAISYEAMARVLTVEPDEQWRKNYAGWGMEAGHEVVGVPSVTDALEHLQDGKFDLVVTSKQGGRWPMVHEAAEAQGARTVVVSGDTFSLGWIRPSTEDAARESNVEFINKTGEVKTELGKIFASLDKEDNEEDNETKPSASNEPQPYTEFVRDLVDRWYPMPTEADPASDEQSEKMNQRE